MHIQFVPVALLRKVVRLATSLWPARAQHLVRKTAQTIAVTGIREHLVDA